MSLRAKEEYLRAVHGRYRQATRTAKGQILDERTLTSGRGGSGRGRRDGNF